MFMWEDGGGMVLVFVGQVCGSAWYLLIVICWPVSWFVHCLLSRDIPHCACEQSLAEKIPYSSTKYVLLHPKRLCSIRSPLSCVSSRSGFPLLGPRRC